LRAVDPLREAFAKRCIAAEESIRVRADYERRMAIHNFDSGVPVEDFVRDEFRLLLPTRYSVDLVWWSMLRVTRPDSVIS
jgi:hypothetical protein